MDDPIAYLLIPMRINLGDRHNMTDLLYIYFQCASNVSEIPACRNSQKNPSKHWHRKRNLERKRKKKGREKNHIYSIYFELPSSK